MMKFFCAFQDIRPCNLHRVIFTSAQYFPYCVGLEQQRLDSEKPNATPLDNCISNGRPNDDSASIGVRIGHSARIDNTTTSATTSSSAISATTSSSTTSATTSSSATSSSKSSTTVIVDTQAKSASGNKSSQNNTSSHSTRTNDEVTVVNTKLKDLRSKELKLKKWENELKQKETQLQMGTEEARRREDYINKVEARNKELEQSVRILQRRIVMLEEGKENIHSEGGSTGSTNNCQDKTKHILE